MKTVLITGGAGYIGSHTAVTLLEAGFEIVIIDNLCNSTAEVIERISRITGRRPIFIDADIRDSCVLAAVFTRYNIDTVIHFAGFKSVKESIINPLMYFDNNVYGSLVLLQEMVKANIFNIIFSSSATVYGDSVSFPFSETSIVGNITNPYGRSKLMVEDILRDLASSDVRWRIAILRYFNPVGAHESGLIGESPKGIPNNLLPLIARAAFGEAPELSIFGTDYPTHDGTGVRDYIHVVDLAEGHLKALDAIQQFTGAHVWNLGTGKGYSVLDMISAFESASGMHVPYKFSPRRPGDIAICFADCSKASKDLNWSAKRGLSDIMRDLTLWLKLNPTGY